MTQNTLKYKIALYARYLIYVVYHYSRAKRASAEGEIFCDKWYTTYINKIPLLAQPLGQARARDDKVSCIQKIALHQHAVNKIAKARFGRIFS